MKTLFAFLALFILSFNCFGQKYVTYQKTDNVTFSYKWGKAKVNDQTVPALLLKVANTNDHPIEYRLSVDLYFEGILRESGDLQNCVEANKTRTGKLNGVYLIPEKFTSDQIGRSDFKLELNDISVTKVVTCETEILDEMN